MKSLKAFMFSLVMVLGVFSSTMVHSYAYNPFTTMTGQGVFAVNPFVYTAGLNPFSLNSDLLVSFGILPNLDVFVNLGTLTYTPDFTPGSLWSMVRFDLGANNIVALKYSETALSPQYHFFWENEIIALEANLVADFSYDSMDKPVLTAYLAPVLKIVKDTLSVYCEVDPKYDFSADASYLNIVPGVWLGLGSYGQFSVACTIADVTSTNVAVDVGAWYWVSFDTKIVK